MRAFGLLLTLSLLACAMDPYDLRSEDVSSSELALASTPLLFFCGGACDFALPSHRCFLTGVRGSAEGLDISIMEQVAVDNRLWVSADHPVLVSITCLSEGLPFQQKEWKGGGTITLGKAPGRQCFLTGFNNVSSLAGPGDYIKVWHGLDGTWYLGGGGSGLVLGFAACIDGVSYDTRATASVGPGQFTQVPLLDDAPASVCALNTLAGNFTSTSLALGAYISFSDGDWSMALADDKVATATCFH